jgi:integrase
VGSSHNGSTQQGSADPPHAIGCVSRTLSRCEREPCGQRLLWFGRPVRFELSEQTRQAGDDYLRATGKRPGEFLFIGHRGPERSIATRQYARLVSEWIGNVGLDPRLFGTHSLRRTKATLIYRRTGNLRAVLLLLGHTKVRFVISASRLMRWQLRNRLMSEPRGQSGNALPGVRPPGLVY